MQYIEQWVGSNIALTLQVFSLILGALVLNFIVQRFLRGLKKQLDKTETPWDDLFISALSKPMAFLIALLGVSYAIQLINKVQQSSFLAKVDGFRAMAILILMAWFLLRFVGLAEKVLKGRAKDAQDRTTVIAVAKLVRLAIIITAVLTCLQTLGYSIQGVLAFGGVGGIAVGFAAKDLLANFFGGLMIYLDRPFAVGDWVRSPDREIEGTVEHIGWRLTLIRTFDKRPLYVPNSVFTSISLENPSRMQNRRIYETIGVRYGDVACIEKIIIDVKAMLKQHKDIDTKQTLMVNFNTFAPSSLDFFIYTFTKTIDWVEYHQVKQAVLLEVLSIIESYGAEVAFPTSTVHLNQLPHEPDDALKSTC